MLHYKTSCSCEAVAQCKFMCHLMSGHTIVMRNAATLEAQLAEARNNNAQLQSEVEKLNDTVFSKTFRAPSAWAEREVKYKMEKKDWDTQVEQASKNLFACKYG